MTEMSGGRLLDVVRNITGHSGPAGNYDGYMYVCRFLIPWDAATVGLVGYLRLTS